MILADKIRLKEIIMRFDTSSRRCGKKDLEEFTNFLEMRGQKREKTDTEPTVFQSNGGKSLAMVYPEKQCWRKIYDPEVALSCGTIFEELDFPFKHSKCRGNNFGEGCLL